VITLVAFLEAYFDESYSDKKPRILAVAGYIFEKGARLQFDLESRALLDRYSLPYFHMVDCGPGNPPFHHMDKDERAEAATQMIALIRRYALFGVAYAINQDDHSSLFPDGFFPKWLSTTAILIATAVIPASSRSSSGSIRTASMVKLDIL
jgi:hypothetical protein